MIDAGDIKEIVYGTKTRTTPKPPFLQVVYDTATCDNTTFGQVETWTQPIKIGSTVKENKDPQVGFNNARALISDARNYLLANRDFGIPGVVRTVKSTEIITVPFPFGDKLALYGAGTTIELIFIINNE